MTLLKRFIFLALFLSCVMEVAGQNIPNVSILVVPYKKAGETYKMLIDQGADSRIASAEINRLLVKKGVSTKDFNALYRAQMRSTQYEQGTADSNDKQLILNSGAEVYIETDVERQYGDTGLNSVVLKLTAFETATGTVLASKVTATKSYRTTQWNKLCLLAAKMATPEFSNMIATSLENKNATGLSVSLRISVGEDCMRTMNDPVASSGPLSRVIRRWVAKNAQDHKFHIQGIVDEYMLFDNVQIPTKDADGIPMDASEYAYQVQEYLSTLGIPSHNKVEGSAIYIILD